MAITITLQQAGSRDIFGPQAADSIVVADGAVSAALDGGIYRIKANTDSVIRIGESPGNAAGGEPFSGGETEARSIPSGFRIACDGVS